jgi:hypothetical protein
MKERAPMATEEGNPFAGVLNAIPGYRGYRDKEDRRDADRRVRERVANSLSDLAGRVETVARSLADQRQITAIAPVDDFAKSIRHVVNRISTATYGYGGLFSDRDVDENALDQLQQFDQSLMDSVATIEKSVEALEQAHQSGSGISEPAREGTEAVRQLNRRLDTRAQVIETAKPAPQESIREIISASKAAAPPAIYDLHDRDAVTISTSNYVVDARIDVQAGADSFRLFRLDESAKTWLLAPSTDQRAAFLVVEASTPPAGAPPVEVPMGSGEGTVIAGDRKSESRPLTFSVQAPGDGTQEFTLVLNWPNEQQVFTGKEVALEEIEIYPARNQSA